MRAQSFNAIPDSFLRRMRPPAGRTSVQIPWAGGTAGAEICAQTADGRRGAPAGRGAAARALQLAGRLQGRLQRGREGAAVGSVRMGRGRAAPREAPEGEAKATKGGGFPLEKTRADGYRRGSEGSQRRSATVCTGDPLGGGEGGGSRTSLGGTGRRREAEKEGETEEKGGGGEGLGGLGGPDGPLQRRLRRDRRRGGERRARAWGLLGWARGGWARPEGVWVGEIGQEYSPAKPPATTAHRNRSEAKGHRRIPRRRRPLAGVLAAVRRHSSPARMRMAREAGRR